MDLTDEELQMLLDIGGQVKGPRHMATLDATPETLLTLDSLIEKNLAESTRYIQRDSTPTLRACLTGKGWTLYRERALKWS